MICSYLLDVILFQVPEQNHEIIWNDAREASHGRSISLSDAIARPVAVAAGRNYLELLIIHMSSIVTGITKQMGPHMWTLRWLVDVRFLSLVSSGHTFTPWQLSFSATSDLAKQITMFIMVKATFCWPKLAFRGPQCWKLHKFCRRKRQRGMLGSLLSAFFHQELRITPEPFWTLSRELISRTSQNFHLMPYRVPWETIKIEKWTRTSDNTKNLGLWR